MLSLRCPASSEGCAASLLGRREQRPLVILTIAIAVTVPMQVGGRVVSQ